VPWFNVLQHLSTVLGGLVVVGWCIAYGRRRGELSLLWRSDWRRRAVGLIVAFALLVAIANGSRGPFGADFWTAQRLLGRIAVGALLGGALGILVFALRHRRGVGAT
jgi:small ligand-binding sensory domain FIST